MADPASDAMFVSYSSALESIAASYRAMGMEPSDQMAAMVSAIGFALGNHPANSVAMIHDGAATVGRNVKRVALDVRSKRRTEGRGL